MIVDDDDFLLNMYSLKFSKSGAEVLVSRSGSELLDHLKSGVDPDVILLDIVLPGMNGIEILEEIRKNKFAPDSKIVMLTNQNDESEIAKANALGVAGYIVKSSETPSEVVENVLSILKSK